MLSEPFGSAAAERGSLRRVLVSWTGPAVELHAVFPARGKHTPKVKAFVDFLADNLNIASDAMKTLNARFAAETAAGLEASGADATSQTGRVSVTAAPAGNQIQHRSPSNRP